jgi:peptidoglycan hydrolase CwlO-like protein
LNNLHKRDTIKTGKQINTMKQIRRLSRFLVAPRMLAVFALIALLISSFILPALRSQTFADTCTSITECQAKIAASSNALTDLKKTALSYQDAIDQLNGQIGTLQDAIDASTTEQNRLQGEIDKAQAEITRQRSILAQGVKAMYVDGTPSTLEMVVTSKNLSDYVDKAEYRTAVQRKLQDTLKKIAALQKQLSVQKAQVAELLKQQQEQQSQLVAARTEQANMLAYNKSQQAAFNADVAANQAKLNELIIAQRRANSVSSYPAGTVLFIRVPGAIRSHNIDVDDYPYRDAGFSMQLGPCSNYDSYPDSPDRWGYCTRQCVSYVAWAVERSGRTAPYGWGNAKEWVNSAPSSWVHTTPEVGDVAISTSGTWGHAMYVEAVDGNKILVSQYNANLTGQYSVAWRSYQ